jgi:hypothetical protein
MADDRMRNDDLDRNMGGTGQQKDDFGKQTPGRNKQDDDLSTGQRNTGQQNEPKHKDDFGNSGKSGAGQGAQNR